MRIVIQSVALVAPLILGVMAEEWYRYLNIQARMFVDYWSCGCDPFPNTNHLSLAFYFVLVSAVATLGWHFSEGIPKVWRKFYVAGIIVAGCLLFRRFLYYNAWL
jgi:hypothetical protein